MFRKLDAYLLLVALLSLFSIGPLLQPGYFWEAHDARHSVYFLFELDRGIQDGVLYPRWQPDFAFGYGYPFFNIYGPLASYAGEAWHLMGFGFADSVKIVFGLSVVASGLAMYGFARKVLDDGRHGGAARQAALVAAVAYMVIPYRLLDIYVRAALAESVAYVFVPLVLWAAWATIRRPRQANVLGLALAYAGLMFTSPLVTLLLTVILFFYLLVLALAQVNDEQPWRQLSRGSALPWLGHMGHILAPAAFGLALGLGLSAVFAIPALTENRFVRVDQWYGGRYAWGGDFVEFFQLFSPVWGSGVSVPGPDDQVSFQLGIVPAVLSLFSLVVVLRRHRSEPAAAKPSVRLAAFFVTLTAVAVWLMLAASAPLWKALPLARLVQFPWRLLAVTTVSMAFLCGVTAWGLWSERSPARATPTGGTGTAVALALAALLILGSLPYMQAKMSERPVSMVGLMQFQQSSDEMTGSTAWVTDIPRWSPMADLYVAGEPLTSKINYTYLYRQAQTGKITAETLELHTNRELIAYSATDSALITFNTFYYPGWRAYLVDAGTGRSIQELSIATRGSLGLITVRVPAGEGRVLLRFEDTPIRKLSTAITFATLTLVLALVAGRFVVRRRPDRTETLRSAAAGGPARQGARIEQGNNPGAGE
jgi:6-pyruvoyl-tetrahydropterin synthase related domain